MARNSNIDKRASGAVDPATGVVAINYSGGNQVLAMDSRRLYITTAGNLSLVFVDGTTAVLPVLANTTYEWAVRVINQTGSTAAGFVLL